MVVRDTSFSAYNHIRATGLLSKRRFQVYQILFENGPLTANQIYDLAKNLYGQVGFRMALHQRLSELVDIGVVKELGIVKCPLSGREVLLWDVTSKIPTKRSRETKKTSKQIIKELEDKIKTLEFKLSKCSCGFIQGSLF